MLRIKNKIAMISILGMLGLGLTGCGNKDDKIVDDNIYFYHDDKNEISNDDINIENSNIPVRTIEIATAIGDVNIRTAPIDGTILDVLYKGESLPLVEELDNGWCAVLYNDSVAYISGKYLSISTEYEIDAKIKDVYYTSESIELNIPKEFSNTDKEEVMTIDKNVCVLVYAIESDSYLVSVNGHIGYIGCDNLIKLSDEFAVVDISDKTLTLYKDSVVESVLPISINGSLEKGLFYIYDVKNDRLLIGKDYNVYVDYISYYDGNSSYITSGSKAGINVDESNIEEVAKRLYINSPLLIQE